MGAMTGIARQQRWQWICLAAIVALLMVGCGRLGFEPKGGASAQQDAALDAAADAALEGPSLGPALSLAASTGKTCAVLADHSLWCWGTYLYYGATPAFDPATKIQIGTDRDWASVVAGDKFTCGLKLDGTLWCWGRNARVTMMPQPTLINSEPNWLQIAAGLRELCAIDTSGRLFCSPMPFQEVWANTAWLEVATENATCAIRADHTLWCWGAIDGQVLTTPDTTIWQVGTDADWLHISVRYNGACGIRMDHSAWCWNDGVPKQIGTARDWEALTFHGDFASANFCGIRNHALWCWGENGRGQVGDGTTDDSSEPRLIDNTRQWTALAMSSFAETCGLADGHVRCTGYGVLGALGDGVTRWPSGPTRVAGEWLAFSPGVSVACGVAAADRSLWCWGSEATRSATSTQIHAHDSAVPVQVDGGTWSDVVVEGRTGSAIFASNTSSSWFSFGNQTSPPVLGRGIAAAAVGPFPLAPLAGSYKSLAAGGFHACAIDNSGQLFCWGPAFASGLGFATTTDVLTPRLVPTGINWRSVQVGSNASSAIDETNRLFTWGSGVTGSGSNVGTTQPTEVSGGGQWLDVALGYSSMCGIKTDHTLWCWGSGFRLGTAADVLVPTQWSADTDWATVAGATSMCAVKTNGTLWCWGLESGFRGSGSAVLRDPVQVGTATNWTTLRGNDEICGLRSDNSLWCWGGYADNGTTGNGLAWRTTFGLVAPP